jgi:UDP-N-acetylmuramate dehydrogenase
MMNETVKRNPINLPASASLSDFFVGRLQKDIPLARFTAARVGGSAEALLVVESVDELVEAVSRLWELGIPFFVIGSGSNILVSDAGIDGVVLVNNARQIRFDEQNEPVKVWAESGASLGLVARKAAVRGLSGLEWAAGIPGTVGGAVVGNAGAHGGDTAGSLILAEILHLVDMHEQISGSVRREDWPVEKMAFAYRTSILKRSQGIVVLAAYFKLERSTSEAVLATMEGYTDERKRSQPPGASMGSIFKNPPDDYAGRLIEACGLKGRCIGDAEISRQHANFFINRGQAKAADIYHLIQIARSSVAEKFGVNLELEIELVGNWVTND